MTTLYDYANHSPFSDPGVYGTCFDALEPGAEAAAAAARNLIVHYRGSGIDFPPDRREEINSRWLSSILKTDQDRHQAPLTAPRREPQRVAGCCRDFALVTVGILRHQGIPARTRIGFAGHFVSGYHHDHVVIEWWTGERWQRMDPELEDGSRSFDVRDLPVGDGAPFETAAEVWIAYRDGKNDPTTYGVAPGLGLEGPAFIRDYVIRELAHRQKQELLLWDSWGAMGSELGDDLAVIDEVADLLVAADAGDDHAEQALVRKYAEDDRLHPGEEVTQFSPYGDPSKRVRLERLRPVA